jgi:hypothetical protein
MRTIRSSSLTIRSPPRGGPARCRPDNLDDSPLHLHRIGISERRRWSMPALCIEDQLQEMAKLRPVLVDGTAVAYFRNRLRISYRRRRSSQKTRGAPGAPRSKDLSREASFASFTSSKLTVAAVNPNPPQVAGAKALPKDWPFPAGTMRSALGGWLRGW